MQQVLYHAEIRYDFHICNSWLCHGRLQNPCGPFAFNRLRIFPKDGKRIVIVEDVLGWDETEFAQLESALSKIVSKEY